MTLAKLIYITGFLLSQWDIHIGKPSAPGLLVGSMEVATTQAFKDPRHERLTELVLTC